ncbi:DUF3237 domain-containing protein, partial [Nonomuraea sp. RK-328]|nr:DUF3237 domain-containing protein [Nonomuraea sp. RK-328]
MAIELIPLCTAQLRMSTPIDLGKTPTGQRVVAEIEDATFTGERFSAKLAGRAAADWFTASPSGAIGTPDVRLTVQTGDGAHVLIRYTGRFDTSGDLTAAVAYIAPLFETGDERYQWLAGVQAVGKGGLSADFTSLEYEIYEVR